MSQSPPPACNSIREELIACVIRSDCVLKTGRSVAECIKHRDELPQRCQHLITSFTDCKKGMLDMRRRFRGNHLSNQEKTSERGSGGLAGTVEVTPEGGRR